MLLLPISRTLRLTRGKSSSTPILITSSKEVFADSTDISHDYLASKDGNEWLCPTEDILKYEKYFCYT